MQMKQMPPSLHIPVSMKINDFKKALRIKHNTEIHAAPKADLHLYDFPIPKLTKELLPGNNLNTVIRYLGIVFIAHEDIPREKTFFLKCPLRSLAV